MKLDRYEYKVDMGFSRFLFESVGPRGVIKKAVIYRWFSCYNNIAVINLAFGDWDIKKQRINDIVVSNNNDRDKILATVASTVLDYTGVHGHCLILAEGSTPSRTRLYQMGINAHRAEIESMFIVLGFCNGGWMPFESGSNFEAFLVYKK